MAKVKVKITINNEIIEEKGILKENVLKLKDKETTLTFNYDTLILTRDNDEYNIKLDFNNEKMEYKLKNTSQIFYTDFIILSLTNYDKQVMINYRIEETDFSLNIKYETI